MPPIAPWFEVHDDGREIRKAVFAVGGWSILLLAVIWLPGTHFSLPSGPNAALHMLFETVSIAVSALVFAVGWHTFSRQGSSSVALVCNAFLAVAILDFVHMLSFEGMPPILTPSGGGKAIAFFLAARLVAALALLSVGVFAWERHIDTAPRNWLFALCLAFAITVSLVGLLEPDVRNLFYVPGRGLTPLKIGLEYVVIALNVAAALLFLRRAREPQHYPAVILFTAAAMAALSEVCFTLYARSVDQFNILGHVYKLASYLLVYQALFVTLVRVPYRQLEVTRRDLQDSEEKYRMLFEANRDALLLIRPDGTLQAANAAACGVFGMARDQLLHATPDMVADDDGKGLVVLFDDLWQAGRSDGELQLRRGDGSTFAAEVSGSVFVSRNGEQAAVVVVRDISERKKAHAEILRLNQTLEQRVQERTAHLEAANRELDSFCYSISHDLRAPLRAVDGFSRSALEKYGALLPAEGQHYLERARAGAQKMAQLIDSLLEFSRAGRSALHVRPVRTEALVRECVAVLRQECAGRTVEVNVASLPPCVGDPDLLRQVWTNLLSNAFKYTGNCSAARIDIAADSSGNCTTYSVRDNGAGFDMADAKHLFGVFQRLHTEREFPGVGVGLALVRRIVERHGGRVWAEAQPDRGATFFFTLGPAT